MGLKQTGRYHLILVAERYDPNLFNDVFDEIISYNVIPHPWRNIRGMGILSSRLNPWWLKRIIERLDVDLIHAHAEPNTIPEIAIKYARCPAIYDAYDFAGIKQGIDALNPREREAERFCLENADGIVHKGPDLEIDFYRNAGYKIKAPALQFQDYCIEEFIVKDPLPKLSDRDGETHIVYTGNVLSMNLPKRRYGFAQFGELAEIFANQKIHFHIYPNPYQLGDFSWYEVFAQKTPYFHIHDSLPIGELNKEISQYDYGAWIHFREGTMHTHEAFSTAIGNKLFTYLEAGLPIIINDELAYGCELLNQYGIGIVLSKPDLKNFNRILEKVDYENLRHNVEKAKAILSMDNQIDRLEDFYAMFLKETEVKP
jgi:hypothetical protein